MKFEVQKERLVESVNNVMKAVSTRTSLPILTGIKIQATNDGLYITGSNSDIYIEELIPSELDGDTVVTIEQAGSIVLNAKYFSEIIKKMPKKDILIDLDGLNCKITSGKSSFTLLGIDAEEYPKMPSIDEMFGFKMKQPELKAVIQQTVFAVSASETRPILTGVKWQIKGNRLSFVATDSHRLSERKISIEQEGEGTFVLPGKSLNELNKILGDSNDVEIAITENQIAFKFGNTLFYSRLLSGTYPDTSRLIPTDNKTKITIDKDSLFQAIDRASLLARENQNNVITLTIDGGQFITISSKLPQIGTVNEEIVAHEVEGEELKISFNSKYAMDALKALKGDTVELSFAGAMRPFLIRSTSFEELLQLQLPVKTY